MINNLILIILLGLFFSLPLAAVEKSDAFYIKAYDNYYKITGPDIFVNKTSIVVENMTMGEIIGKVIDDKHKTITHMTIKAQSFKSHNLNFELSKRYYFIPLIPAFQSIEIVPGKRSYEIPGRR